MTFFILSWTPVWCGCRYRFAITYPRVAPEYADEVISRENGKKSMLGCIDPAVLKLSAHEEYQTPTPAAATPSFVISGSALRFRSIHQGFRGGGITVLGHHDWILCRAPPDMVLRQRASRCRFHPARRYGSGSDPLMSARHRTSITSRLGNCHWYR